MTNIDTLYKIADENGINIHELNFDEIIFVPSNIAVDVKKIDKNIDLSDILSRKLGHCITGSFYNPENILDLFEKQEYKANLWGFKQPNAHKLQKNADYFGVTVDYLLGNDKQTTRK